MECVQPIITLITDFGTADGYVGAMKGVMLSICPQAQLVDITHNIPPQDLYRAAFSLYQAAPFYPANTVHLVVVDPGVGTSRRPLALRAGNMTFVGPDNGVFSLIARPPQQVVALENPNYLADDISNTFHGRDVFAPAAAHLAGGVPLIELGPAVDDWVTLPFPTITLRPPYKVLGEVLYLDHFGNAVCNIGVLRWKGSALELNPLFAKGDPVTLPAQVVVQFDHYQFPLRRTYGEVPSGQPLTLIGSSGLLEIAVRDGHAGQVLNIRPGDMVVLDAQQPS